MQRPTKTRVLSSQWLLFPLAALAALAPLLMHGASCGQDLAFHVVSWLDAAQQLRQGHYPHWAIAPAWNAGEPRFIFYPPLSWLLGAALTMVFPASSTPVIFVCLVLIAAAFSMYRLTRTFTSQTAATLASAFYIGNPYMLFNAFERSAMAELMAAAWIPLLLLAVLRAQPRVREIAVPLAFLWLTNAPAAVMSSYLLALIAIMRFAYQLLGRTSKKDSWREHLRFALTFVAGTFLGLALPAFYLVPAAYERRHVQVAMAIIPNMRFQDNFLFDRTADAAHNAVNHTASLLALTVVTLTVVTITGLALRIRKALDHADQTQPLHLGILATITCGIAYLLVPISTPFWLHLPELAYLQFPWRLLSLLSVVLALALALLLKTIPLSSKAVFAAPVLSLLLSIPAYRLYTQHCELSDKPSTIAALLQAHHGVPPTDEYTPNNADNDILRTSNPGYWLASIADTPAPHTQPTAVELNPDLATDDTPVPSELTASTPAPHHLHLDLPRAAVLVLNLRDFPNWQVTRTPANDSALEYPSHLQREDGLLAVALPAGTSTIDIRWRRTPDQWVGIAITILALLDLLSAASFLERRSQRPVQTLT